MVKCKTLQRGYNMTNISEIIEEILVEWAYRVHDGMPNPKNAQHIHELRESMEELNLPNKVIYEVINNLITEKKNKESFTPLKDYGGPVSMRRVSYPIDREDYMLPAPIRKPFRGYDSMGSYDDGSVEIDLSRSNYRSGVSHGEPQFKSKVAESIWRLKNKK